MRVSTPFVEERGGSVHLNTFLEGAEWDEDGAQWRIRTRTGELSSDFLVVALPFEATEQLLPQMPAVEGKPELAAQD